MNKTQGTKKLFFLVFKSKKTRKKIYTIIDKYLPFFFNFNKATPDICL